MSAVAMADDGDGITQEQFTAYLALQGFAENSTRNYRAMFVRWCDWAIAHGHDPFRPGPLEVRAWAGQVNDSGAEVASVTENDQETQR